MPVAVPATFLCLARHISLTTAAAFRPWLPLDVATSLTIGSTAARTHAEDVRRTLWLTGCDAEWPLSQTRRLYYCVREGASSLSARLGGAWALLVYEKGSIHASETGAAGGVHISRRTRWDRRRLHVGLRSTDLGLPTSRTVERAALAGRAGVLRQGSRRKWALTRFELLRMDGDETTSVERQYGRMQGLRVSHRRVMLSARAPGGVAGAEPRGAIVPSRSVCCDRARVLRLRCAGVYSVHDSSHDDDDEHGRGAV